MKYKILQAKTDEAFSRYFKSFSYDRAKERGFDLNDYKVVYESFCKKKEGKKDVDFYLGEIYMKFNNKIPKDFSGHTICVGDIIELDGKKYFINTIGFSKVD